MLPVISTHSHIRISEYEEVKKESIAGSKEEKRKGRKGERGKERKRRGKRGKRKRKEIKKSPRRSFSSGLRCKESSTLAELSLHLLPLLP